MQSLLVRLSRVEGFGAPCRRHRRNTHPKILILLAAGDHGVAAWHPPRRGPHIRPLRPPRSGKILPTSTLPPFPCVLAVCQRVRACEALTPAARSPLAEGVRLPPPPRGAAADGDCAPSQAPAGASEELSPRPHPAQLRSGLLIAQRQARMQIPWLYDSIRCPASP